MNPPVGRKSMKTKNQQKSSVREVFSGSQEQTGDSPVTGGCCRNQECSGEMWINQHPAQEPR